MINNEHKTELDKVATKPLGKRKKTKVQRDFRDRLGKALCWRERPFEVQSRHYDFTVPQMPLNPNVSVALKKMHNIIEV